MNEERSPATKKPVTLAVAAVCVVAVAIALFVFLRPDPASGKWYSTGFLNSPVLVLDNGGTAEILYLRGEDEYDAGMSQGIIFAETAKWEQEDDGSVTITYVPSDTVPDSLVRKLDNFNVYLVYGEDADGDECLSNLETGDKYYRSVTKAQSK